MAEAAAAGQAGGPRPRTLAGKVNWLIERACPAGRGPYSNLEVSALIAKVTGEEFSHTTIWKLRNGQAANPQMRLIQALATTFGVPPAFFFDDYDEDQSAQLMDQVELLTLMRDSGVTSTQLRALAALAPAARQALVDLIEHTAPREKDEPGPH
jgi:ESX-1-secreted protein regulator